MERVTYGQPRRFNAVTLTLLLMMAAAGYWMWRFFPVYLDAWTVDHVLKETASALYRLNRSPPSSERDDSMRELLDKAKADIRKQANITDPDLTVAANIEGDKAVLSAMYTVSVTHPILDKVTTLHFKREEDADLKRVDWDNQ